MRLASAALGVALGLAAPTLAQTAWQPGHSGLRVLQKEKSGPVQLASARDLALKAGRSQEVTLRFVIGDGLHINSHTPRSQFMIPTALRLEPSSGLAVAGVQYPPGVEYHFAFAPNDVLSVYTGQLALLVRLKATPGRHVLQGQLKYQACDQRACRPPEDLPVTLRIDAE